jgi:hypothetical protein
MKNERSTSDAAWSAVRFFASVRSEERAKRERGGGFKGGFFILPILSCLLILCVLFCLPAFSNPVKRFDGDNWNSIFDKSGRKDVKNFEKSVLLVVKFDHFG